MVVSAGQYPVGGSGHDLHVASGPRSYVREAIALARQPQLRAHQGGNRLRFHFAALTFGVVIDLVGLVPQNMRKSWVRAIDGQRPNWCGWWRTVWPSVPSGLERGLELLLSGVVSGCQLGAKAASSWTCVVCRRPDRPTGAFGLNFEGVVSDGCHDGPRPRGSPTTTGQNARRPT